MQETTGGLLLSATDLVAFLECEHLSALDLRVARGIETIERTRTDSTELLARKGIEHERRYLDSLIASGLDVVTVPASLDGARGAQAAVAETEAAMRAGAQVIYQAALAQGEWRGYADFLERVAIPSGLGDWSYEVIDTKLARRAKPEHVVQLCLYSELLARAQALTPAHAHVVLGTSDRESLRLTDFAAFFRRLLGRYEGRLGADFAGTYPQPVAHCDLCRYAEACKARWVADDHATLIAGVGGTTAIRLREGGIGTGTELAHAAPEPRPRRIGATYFERLRNQARLQVAERASGVHTYELLEPEHGRGFELLPRRRPGDLYFDIEGDPFYEGEGLEYLLGVSRVEDGELRFRAFWAHDRVEEKRSFEDFIDFVLAARADDAEMHVYHYAAYEPRALKTLMGRHGTREEEVDKLLREKVLVDLLAVTRQSLRTSRPSYSLKDIEAFYMDAREEEVTEAGDSIVRFEEWLQTGEQALLDSIAAYNEVDCLSTYKLHGWLLERREEARREFGAELPWREPPEPDKRSPDAEAIKDEVARLEASLLDGLPDDLREASEDERGRWLMAQLLHYHRREARPAWWAYFARLESSSDELVDDAEAIGNLEPDPESGPLAEAHSLIYTLRFPEQEHRLSPGDEILDPATRKGVDVVEIDDAHGLLRMRRAEKRSAEPLPRSLIPGGPYWTGEQRAALRRVASAITSGGIDGPGPFRGLRDILCGRPRRVVGVAAGEALISGSPHIDELEQLVDRLDESCLFIQGPPGSGKTWTGARLIVHLIARGARVGVAATSHKAIHNLLDEVEEAAVERGVRFTGWKKCGDDAESRFTSKLDTALIVNERDGKAFPPPDDVRLVAGTAWLFSPESMDGALDYVVIDEAGQVALADAIAMGTSARNVILLGDPLQLAQVSQGTHPEGAGASVLEHLLGDDATIPPERGVFLDRTRRMHPNVCAFISEVIYEDRLNAIPECAVQRIYAPGPLTGTGLRFIATDHTGNTRASVEEVEAIAAAVAELKGATVTLADGSTRALERDDVMVVTPYNAQVRCLAERLPSGVRIGTVDKFQGQEAQVVFFSMATSTDTEVPRNVEFLYSRNRLNVAVSRARCLSVLVCSQRLLDLRPRSVEQARLVNALCRFVEIAESVAA
jgi:predicted RecB family nuclease